MRTTIENHVAGHIFFRTLLLAIAATCVALGAMNANSAALPARGTTASSVQIPAGECWDTITAQNVLTGGNYLNGIDGDLETGAILAAGYYTTDIGLHTEGGVGNTTQMAQFYTGSSFQTVPNPPGLGPNSRLNGVGAIPGTDNEFWLVGNATTTTVTTTFTLNIIERFNGSSLSIVPNPQPYGVSNRLTDVDAASPSFAIAVGLVIPAGGGQQQGVIYRWDGTSWTLETPPTLTGPGWLLDGVTTFVDGRAVAVGFDYTFPGRHVILTRSTSGVWTQVATPLPGTGARLRGVDAVSPTDVVAVGDRDTLDGGRPYSVLGNLDANTWDIVYMDDDEEGNIYAYGVSCALEDVADSNSGSVSTCYIAGFVGPAGFASQGGEEFRYAWKQAQGSILSIAQKGNPLGIFLAAFAWEPNAPRSEGGGGIEAFFPANYFEPGGAARVEVDRYVDACGTLPTPTPGGPTATPVVATPTPGPPTATPTPCTPGQFSDVPPEHTFYAYITCLVENEVISGYADCTFRPANNITRGQLSKVVSNAAGFTEPVSGQTFEDIPVGSTFYDFVERLASRSIIGGYACGGPGEPCVPPGNRPYFRPNANSTRGQITKIVAVAANFQDPTTNQTFEDVPVGSTFHLWIENLASRGIMSGYACGGAGEPCVPPGNRPYFRPSNNATRGQTSKIVANTFFPSCSPGR